MTMRWPLVCLLFVGCLSPRPVGPVDPNNPPAPTPAPVVTGPVALLIVEDDEGRDELPQSQRDILASPRIREYLREHGRDGGRDAFRLYSDRDDVSAAPPFWREGFQRPRTRLPWVVITNGKAGAEGPLPATEDELLSVLKKYGG